MMCFSNKQGGITGSNETKIGDYLGRLDVTILFTIYTPLRRNKISVTYQHCYCNPTYSAGFEGLFLFYLH